MPVAVYCRVSTDDQACARTIENQVVFARRYCELHGLEVYDFYLDDGVSGSVPVEIRPAGSSLLKDASRGVLEAVYVYRLDRLARTTLDILKTHQILCGYGVALKSMTENFDTSTPSGKFFMTTLGGIAEIERETIAERMRVGKERALREGRWPGGPPPYGYGLAGKRLVISEGEASVVRAIFSIYTGGGMSTASIADYLNAIGVPSPAGAKNISGGNRWHGSRIWGILANPVYGGTFLYGRRGGKSTVEVECPPVVSREEWEAAGEARQRKAVYAARNSRWDYLLKGLVRCSICGRKFMGDGSGKEGRTRYYRCSGSTSFRGDAKKCPARSVRADLIEKTVWEDVCRFVLKLDHPPVNSPEGAVSQEREPAGGGPEEIDRALLAKEAERKRIVGLFRRGIITEADVGVQISCISREVEALKKRRSEMPGKGRGAFPPSERADYVRQRLSAASSQEKRDLVRSLVEDIAVDLESRENRVFPRITVCYIFDGFTDCALYVETRGKYRLGVPKSLY